MSKTLETDAVVFVSLTELGYPKPTIRDAVYLAQQINREVGLLELARLNIIQALANLSGDFEIRTKIQERLISTVVSERRLRELQDKLRYANVGRRPLIHRAQLLVGMKLLAAFGNRNGGNMLVSRDDWDVLGEFALIINSLFDFGTLTGLDKNLAVRELTAQMAPVLELENPRPIAEGMVRLSEMLGPILDDTSSPFTKEIQAVFPFLTRGSSHTGGMDFAALLEMVFALYSFYSGREDEILNHSGILFFDPYNPGHIVRSDYLEGFLEGHSINFGEMIAELDSPDTGRAYLLDYTLFRRWPFWRLAPDRYICIDPTFLVEKLSVGFYWSIMNVLDSSDRKEQFAGLWGRLFEQYVSNLLVDAYGTGLLSRFLPYPKYVRPKEEAFDAAIIYGDAVVLVQIKGPFVPIVAKYSGSPDAFSRGLASQFGLERGAAIEQLVRNIKFSFPNKSSATRKIRGIDLSSIRRVLPVVVYQEPILRFGLVTKVLTEEFVKEISSVEFGSTVRIEPVVFLSVEDLEKLCPYIKEGHPSLIDCLDAKLKKDPTHFYSFHDFFVKHFLKDSNFVKRKNKTLEDKWDSLKSNSLGRLESGYYLN